MQKNELVIYCDGGSRGNPGLAACAFVAELKGKVLEKQSKFLNTNTNNVAEYEGVLLALNWLLKSKHAFKENNVIFFLDSELVVKQLNGVYKIKKPELQILNFSDQTKNELGTSTNISFSLPVAPQTISCDNDRLYILAHSAPVIYQISFH